MEWRFSARPSRKRNEGVITRPIRLIGLSHCYCPAFQALVRRQSPAPRKPTHVPRTTEQYGVQHLQQQHSPGKQQQQVGPAACTAACRLRRAAAHGGARRLARRHHHHSCHAASSGLWCVKCVRQRQRDAAGRCCRQALLSCRSSCHACMPPFRYLLKQHCLCSTQWRCWVARLPSLASPRMPAPRGGPRWRRR